MELFDLSSEIQTRWASPENPDAMPGGGGKTHAGRKGSPCLPVKPGETVLLAHAETAGTIRHIWITLENHGPELLRGMVLRCYWDGAEKPAVEAPLGDFFGMSLGQCVAFQNAWFGNPEGRSFNCFLPMPFRKSMRITVTNESPISIRTFFYQIDFTVGDRHTAETGYFHAHFRRENLTTVRRDFEILPSITGRGRYLGCTMGVIANKAAYGSIWWGEGEVKAYIDDDVDYPTFCGTGAEDYIGTAWGLGAYAHQWYGCPVADAEKMRYSFYRLHGPDPILFRDKIRVTIQQIGYGLPRDAAKMMRERNVPWLMRTGSDETRYTADQIEADTTWSTIERQDDWCAVAYFYLDRPSSGLPAIAGYEERVVDLV